MDFSSLPTDPEHPDGTSPWQTTPEANRTRISTTTAAAGPVIDQEHAESHHDETRGDSPTPGASGRERQESRRDSPQEHPEFEEELGSDSRAGRQQAKSSMTNPEQHEDTPSTRDERVIASEHDRDTSGQSYHASTPLSPSNPSDPAFIEPKQVHRQAPNSRTALARRDMADIRFQGPPMTEDEIMQEQLRREKLQERHQHMLNVQQQQRGPVSGRYHANPQRNTAIGQHKVPAYRLTAKITALERTGRKDPAIHFDVQTNLPKFRTTQVRDIKRSHSEFVKLADHLISSNPEAFVPAVPGPVSSAGAGTEEDEIRSKAAMQRWLNIVCGNDVLMRDDEMVLFVESDAGYSPMMRMKQPATGVRRKVLKQFAPPEDSTEELRDARPVVKAFYLGTMDTCQKLDRMVRARRALGTAESDLGVRFGAMQVQEAHTGLGLAYRKLGKIIQTTGDYHIAQGTAECTTLGDPLNYHSSDALIVKETLTNRHILLRDLIAAQQTTKSKLGAADRLKVSSSVRREKVDEAIAHLDEARIQEQYLAQKTQRVTSNLLHEKRQWYARTAANLRANIREYVLREIEAERRALAALESVRPDIRNIDATGGLSRLGREAHPPARRVSTISSQGPKSDAWSGVPRREGALERSVAGLSIPGTDHQSTNSHASDGDRAGRLRSSSQASSFAGIREDDGDEDRVDARNAASRLATSTF